LFLEFIVQIIIFYLENLDSKTRLMNQPEFSAFKPINLSFSSSLSSCSSISSSSSSANCFPSKSSKTMANNTKESKLTDEKLRKNIQPRAKVFDDEVNATDKTDLLQTQNRQDVNPYYMEKFLNFHDMFNLNGVDPFKNVAPGTSNIGLTNEQLFQLNFQQQLIAFQNIFKSAAQNRDLFTANYIKQIQNEYAKNTMTQATNNSMNHKTKMNNQNQYFKNNFSMDRILSLPSKIETSNELNGINLKKEEYTSGSTENEMANFFHNNINSAFPVRTATGFHKLNPQIALSVPLAQSIPTYSTNNNHRQTHQQPHTNSSHSKPMRNVFHSKLEDQPPVYKSKNAKKYKCDLCGRGFSRSNTLITHRVSEIVCLFDNNLHYYEPENGFSFLRLFAIAFYFDYYCLFIKITEREKEEKEKKENLDKFDKIFLKKNKKIRASNFPVNSLHFPIFFLFLFGYLFSFFL